MKILRYTDDSFRADLRALRELLRGGELVAAGQPARPDVPAMVRDVIADVSARGDAAVLRQTSQLEGVELTAETMRVPPERIARAHSQADPDFLALVRRAAENIRRYQEHIRVAAPPTMKNEGRELAVRYTPLQRVGVYVPGGRAIYPSTVLMTVIPAQVAGVERIAMLSPPTGGDIHPTVLALAGELGVEEVYRVSGTAGVAALALGTASMPAVDKIVGPGNAFITEAKRQLFGRIGIDSLAGPSEVLIVADETARGDWIAADLLAQSEHNPGSSVLVTPSAELAADVERAVEEQVATLRRSSETREMIDRYSALVIVESLDDACRIADDFATEHLQIITAEDEATLAKIRHAGAVFLGAFTPVPLGDYYAGPSHVLPTGGGARCFGPLSVNDFLKASSVVRYDEGALKQDAADVIDFATREGLTAHARAVRIRSQ
jgi:histidinol dehydrogenase